MTPPAPTPEARAKSILPLLRAEAPAIESSRRITPAALDALHAQRLFRTLVPRANGGDESPPADHIRMLIQIASADASTAWCLSQAAGCAMAAAYLPAETAKTVWGDDPRAVLAWGQNQGARARIVPGGYRVTGSKIWTTGAHHSNRMFAIVRTGDFERRQQGLTFLLLDMDSPGLTVRPILDLTGEREFNEVFFDGVFVPEGNRVGPENDGWTVAKRLMTLARSNNTPSALVARSLRRAAEAVVGGGEAIEPSLRRRLTGLQIELDAFAQLELAALPSGRAETGAATTPSMLKLIGSELHQRVCELAMEAAGPQAGASLAAIGLNGEGLDQGARAMARYLCLRAASIYSGTSETQRNLIARQLLG